MKRSSVDQGPNLFDWGAAQPVEPSCDASSPGRTESDFVGGADKREPVDCPAPQASASAPVIDFLDRRDSLPRRILNPPPPFVYLDRMIARDKGTMPPAPIIAFGRRSRPPDPGADGNHLGRTG